MNNPDAGRGFVRRPRSGCRAQVETLEHRRLLSVTKLAPLTPELGEFAASGSYLYYTTFSSAGGEVWRTDGTVAGTLRMKSGPVGGKPLHPTAVKNNGAIFFMSNQADQGVQLWSTNGAIAGTSMLKVIEPSNYFSVQSTASNGTLAYFSLFSTDANAGLYVTDGTVGGTAHLPGPTLVSSLANFNGKALFDGGTMTSPSTLWKSDGTATGTVPVAPASVAGSHPRDITTFANLAYYFATPPNHGDALYVTDGTAAGTHLLYRWATPYTAAMQLTVSGPRMFFVAQSASVSTPKLVTWVSDGAANGTHEITNSPALETFGQNLTDVNGTLFFEAKQTLYKIPAGSNTVSQVVPSSTFSAGGVSASYRGHFYGMTNGFQTLWISDGAATGTKPVAEANGLLIAPESVLFNFGDALYFTADLQNHGLYRLFEPPPIIGGGGSGSISGVVFNDKNTNSKRDAAEAGLGGRVVFIDKNKNGKLDAGEASVKTATDGSYVFSKLGPGSYRVVESVPAGWRQTLPALHFYDVTLTSSQAVTSKNFGDTQTVLITGAVFNDANGNAKRDAAETGLSGWTVFLDANNNGKLEASETRVTTNSGGNFSFNVAAGTYVVRVTPRNGYLGTTPSSGFYKLTLSAGSTSAVLLFGRRLI